MKEWINKIKGFVKAHASIIFMLAMLTACASVAYVWLSANNDVKEPVLDGKGDYTVIDGDDLFSLRSDDYKDVTNVIVVVPTIFSDAKHVLISHKGAANADLYKNVNSEGFVVYLDTHLKPILRANTAIDFRYVNSLSGVGKKLGLKNDPVGLITGETAKQTAGELGKLVSTVIFMIIMIAVMMRLQMGSMSNKLDKVDPKDIQDSLDDLVGMADIKRELEQLKGMVENPQHYKKYAADKPFNVMMTGEPGTGKTKIARCLAKDLDVPLYYASAASMETGFVGGGVRSLKSLVKRASKHKRAIIFLDEAESILQSRNRPTRSRYENETMTALLSLLDGVGTKKSSGIIWIVASNFDETKADFDAAMLRRFQLKINFRLPNHEERREIMARLLKKIDQSKLSDDIDLDHVAGVTSGMSPAILETLISRAGLMALQETSLVTHSILLRAFERVAVGLTDRATTAKVDATRKVVAIHEAGHFCMQLHSALVKSHGNLTTLSTDLDVIKISTESVSKLGALGFVLSKTEEVGLLTRTAYQDKIRHLYGGMANEELYFGEPGTTAGADNDIVKVTQMLDMMVNRVGFFSPVKLNYGELAKAGYNTDAQLPKMEQMAAYLYQETMETLAQYRGLTDALVQALMDRYVLTLDEIIPFILTFFAENESLLTSYNPRKTMGLLSHTS